MGDPNDYVGEKSIEPFLLSVGKQAEKGLEASDVIPEKIQSALGPIKLLLDYIMLITKSIAKTGEYSHNIGYAEGFARSVTYASCKEEPFASDVSKIPFIHSTTPGVYHWYSSRQALPDYSDNPVTAKAIERAKGFFEGADAAAESVKKTKTLTAEELLNEIYSSVAKSRGIKEEFIGKIKYFTVEEISKIVKGEEI